ncbi:pyruvate formate-lyase 1-activating enzyme [Paenibacillus sp. FSL H8-0548]|uniref:pyruvate formate-lyase-activating protein n=1 Tax=Paenibacillus sp. FSL H8-0548 TaxID=1920422 RepID=UPI00096FD04E|nr:pyruvate formate-lyase-activating protein [Paenibacillus sp. FSL H8-0548]OMF38645.1 pyruvate formate-lyase 1-activating enzyme [Paenibacillus sp. FSL H8-0548]
MAATRERHLQIEHDRQTKGRIHSFESFGTVDGPGIRFVLFMQGCALRCQFCHNPDTWDTTTGRVLTVDDVIAEIEPFIPYYKASGGGVTFSGGEPSLQAPFLAALGRELKRRYHLHIAMDSSGFCEPSHLQSTALLDVLDLILLDLKMIDEKKHIALTTQSNERIKRMAQYVNEQKTPLWIRHVVIPGVTNDPADVDMLAAAIAMLPTVQKVELLPYHEMGAFKWKQLGLTYELEHIKPPDGEQLADVQQQLQARLNIPVIL